MEEIGKGHVQGTSGSQGESDKVRSRSDSGGREKKMITGRDTRKKETQE